jgi:hypothetical protein
MIFCPRTFHWLLLARPPLAPAWNVEVTCLVLAVSPSSSGPDIDEFHCFRLCAERSRYDIVAHVADTVPDWRMLAVLRTMNE